MNDNEEKIPPFIQDYLNKMDQEGYSDFVKLTRDYHKEREDYPGKYATQSAFQNDFNRRTGQNRQLNYEDGIKEIDERYKKRAYQTAKQHGYKGPDPTQPSDNEFTKQGEKFQGMIDDFKERQQEQKKQPQQKQEAVPGKGTEKIDELKDREAYQQNQPKMEFKGMEQEQPSNTEQQDREQQRAAFLEQIKKTRQQQTQSQQNKQPEI